MEVTVTGRHLEITPAIKEYASGKVAKLPRYFDRIQRIQVIAAKKDKTHEVEVIVSVEHHNDFVVRISGDDLYAAIDQSVDKLERQLTDYKERLRNRKHSDAARKG